MAHFRRPHPDPKRDSYKVKDTCYKAGRAAVMERKRRVPFVDIRSEIEDHFRQPVGAVGSSSGSYPGGPRFESETGNQTTP